MNLGISSWGSQNGSDRFVTCYWVLEKIWSWEQLNTFYMGFIIRILATSCFRSLGSSTNIPVVSRFSIFDWTVSKLQWYRSPKRYDLDFRLEEVIESLILADKFQANEEYNQNEEHQNWNCDIQTVEARRLHERGGREPQEYLASVLGLFQDVFRMLTELVPGVGRIPGTNVFLDLALASEFLNYQGNHSLHYNWSNSVDPKNTSLVEGVIPWLAF